jgi:trans-2-enoyl-CoA reductase
VDNYAWNVNNVLEWYAMYFSPQVIAVQDDMLWGEDNRDNLYWGTDKGFVKADVDAATRSLYARYQEQGGDFSAEIAVYNAAIAAQSEVLRTLCVQETAGMQQLAALLA